MNKLNRTLGAILVMGTLLFPTSALALEKKETVYTNLRYDGTVQKTTINTHLYLKDKGDIEDETWLKDILNINGKESFIQEENKLTWRSTGKDIFYQGTIEKQLPVSVKVTYYLNGKEIDPKKAIGKKGNIKMVLSFENHLYDEESGLYTPMVSTIGMTLKDKDNSNVMVEGGKAVDTGSKNIILGLASPGLYQSTGIEELKGLDEVSITYDTTKFTLNTIYVVTTPKLFEESDLDVFDKLDTLRNSIGVLSTSVDQVESGSKELVQGTETLLEGTTQLSLGLRNAYTGAVALEQGSVQVDAGIEMVQNALTLARNELDTSSLTMLQTKNEVAKESLLNTMKSQGLTDELISLFHQFTVKELALGGTFDDPNTANQALQNYLLNSSMGSNTASIMQLKNLYDIYLLLSSDASALEATVSKINFLSTNIDQLLLGLSNLKNGTIELSEGTRFLSEGLERLYDGSTNLLEGTRSLNDGMKTLSQGVFTLNQEGIKKMKGYTNQLSYYTATAEKLLTKSKEYSGFAASNVKNTIFVSKIGTGK